MPPPLDRIKRAKLLSGVIDYIGEHGLSELSLRPLAASLETSARMLIHYFGSKEQMLIAALETQRPDIAAAFADVADADALRQRLHEGWTANTSGDSATSASVVLQVLGDACVQRGPFLDYATSAVELLVTAIAQVLGRLEPPVEDPTATATIVVSGLRGVLLDRLVTGDAARTDRAARQLIDQTLRATPPTTS
ncbi:TetR/AcrR family transcriptional regulator [Rhodococcus opacus]|uniref:TetR family transcriptional regulator n=1 Tax=Rhodococcus opacus TaxID=37919 RepID=A0A076ED14_RHOOP|nr:TetR/AcrR family transcriptional regulator [Rhodococcus opacus]AII04195.1 TetR family transcriptional regulator [Rhodococcus opacus]